jgi:hypothetical protein
MSDLAKAARDYESALRRTDVPQPKLQRLYDGHQRTISGQIARLNKALIKHSKKQAQQPGHWGYAGDLGHVSELLDEAINFLGG